MSSHAWKVIVGLSVLLTGCHSSPREGTAPTSNDEYLKAVQTASEATRDVLEDLVPEKKTPFSHLLDPSEALKSLEERDKRIAKAVKRIKVSQPARDAGDLMNRGRFEEALKLCDKSLENKSKDGYALYLKGLCLLELGRYAEASDTFRRVREYEPQSRSSVLLDKFAGLLAECEGDVGVKEIVLAWDDARAYATQELKLEDTGDDFFSRVTLPSPLLTDPILFKMDAEAFAGHGPRAFNQERLVRAALEIDEPLAMLALVASLDDEYCGPLYERLNAKQHEKFMDRMDVVMTYFGDDFAFAERGSELEKDVARMMEREPDEMLWKLMRIPFKKSDDLKRGDRRLYREQPLSDQELTIIEDAVKNESLLYLHPLVQQSIRRVLEAAGYPYIHNADDPFKLRTEMLRFVHYLKNRAASTVETALQNDDTELAMRAGSAVRALRERINALYRAGECGLSVMMMSSTSSADNMLAKQPDVPVDVREALLRDLVRSCGIRQHSFAMLEAMSDANGVPLTIAAAAFAQWPGFMDEEWATERARRIANDPAKVQELRGQLRQWRRNDWGIRTDTVLGAVEMRQREILSELRAFHDGKLDTMSRWALIWAAGEFKDAEQAEWLIEQLKSEDELIVRAAADALRKITGRDCGTDAEAWHKAS